MTIELQVLVALSLLFWMLGQIAALGKLSRAGIAWGMGNRETQPEFPSWVLRAERAQRNLGESLPLYAAVTLAGLHLGVSHPTGATLFFAGRVAHAITLTAGITFWRTVAYFVAMTGVFLMLVQLF